MYPQYGMGGEFGDASTGIHQQLAYLPCCLWQVVNIEFSYDHFR